MQKNLNDQVKKGEKLVEIDVPDLVAEVKAKQAVIQQRAREVDLAEKQWEIAVAAEKVAHAMIGQREADQRAAEATAAYRKLRLDRFTELAKSGGVVESVVEEEQSRLSGRPSRGGKCRRSGQQGPRRLRPGKS